MCSDAAVIPEASRFKCIGKELKLVERLAPIDTTEASEPEQDCVAIFADARQHAFDFFLRKLITEEGGEFHCFDHETQPPDWIDLFLESEWYQSNLDGPEREKKVDEVNKKLEDILVPKLLKCMPDHSKLNEVINEILSNGKMKEASTDEEKKPVACVMSYAISNGLIDNNVFNLDDPNTDNHEDAYCQEFIPKFKKAKSVFLHGVENVNKHCGEEAEKKLNFFDKAVIMKVIENLDLNDEQTKSAREIMEKIMSEMMIANFKCRFLFKYV